MTVTVWVVTASRGEYSDRSEWAVEVHTTEVAGQAAVEAYDAEERQKLVGVEDSRRWLYDETAHYLSEVPLIGNAPAALDEAVGLLRRISSAHGACVCGSFECSVPGVGCLGDALHAEVMAARAFLANLEPSQ